jgi:hypothetical protein
MGSSSDWRTVDSKRFRRGRTRTLDLQRRPARAGVSVAGEDRNRCHRRPHAEPVSRSAQQSPARAAGEPCGGCGVTGLVCRVTVHGTQGLVARPSPARLPRSPRCRGDGSVLQAQRSVAALIRACRAPRIVVRIEAMASGPDAAICSARSTPTSRSSAASASRSHKPSGSTSSPGTRRPVYGNSSAR